MLIRSLSEEKKDFEVRKENPESVFDFNEEFLIRKNNLNNKTNKKYKRIFKKFVSAQWSEAKQNNSQFTNPRTLEQLGDIQFLRKNLLKAEKYYIEAIKMNTSLLAVYEKLIFICIVYNKITDANNYYKIILKITDRRSVYLHKYILFKLHFFNKEYTLSEAFKDTEEIINKKPDDYTALNTYGLLYLKSDNFNSASLYFKKALKINPDFSHSLNNLGVCFQRNGEIEKAKNYYELALKNDSSYVAPYENLANYYINKQKIQDAINILNTALTKGLVLSHAWLHQIGWLYIKVNDFKKAIEWYHKMLLIEPKNDLLYNNLGYCYVQLDEIEKGANCFNKAADIFREKMRNNIPCDTRELLAFYNLGRLAISKREIGLLKEVYSEILSYSQDDAFADYLQGSEKVLQECYAEAKIFYLKSLEKRRDIPDIYPNLSFVIESIDCNYQSAIKLLEEAMQNGIVSLLILNNLIYAYIENENLDKAEHLLNTFKNNIPPIIYANKGLLAFRKNDIDNGDYFYKQAVDGFSGINKKVAKQYWLIEKCRYYLRNADREKAKKYLFMIEHKKDTYMRTRIEKLENDFNDIL